MIDETTLSLSQISQLSALAQGIIPRDDRDSGAASVHAGPTIAAKIRMSAYAFIYVDGLADAARIAEGEFGTEIGQLNPEQLNSLLEHLKHRSPDFFRQLRSDVCLIYLSDPGVWQRIGFPGESADEGGYPDFDQPQQQVSSIREPRP